MVDIPELPPRGDQIFTPDRSSYGVVQRPLSTWEVLWDLGAFRKALLLALIALLWEIYARSLNNPLLFPTLSETFVALYQGLISGRIPLAAWGSIKLLLQGYGLGLLAAGLLTAFATTTRIGADLLETLTAMFNPLPSIALLPLAMIWFGFGDGSIVFVLVHAVLWAIALNTHAGFQGVSMTWRMVGRNYGLKRLSYVSKILIPGAFPSILTGLKIGWAFAWRTLIAAELVFGSSSGGGGLGWFIFESKNALMISQVFAGLLTVIIFGLFVENVVFRAIETHTVKKWGMQN